MDKSITLAEYTAYWLAHIAPGKLAKSTLARDKQDIDRFLPALGSYKLTELKPEHFRNRKRKINGCLARREKLCHTIRV